MKFLTEFGPLLLFFLGNWKGGFMWGTGLFMAGTTVALIVSYLREGRIAKFPLVSAIFVGVFGGLTLYLHDQAFFQVKVTLINAALGLALLGGIYFNRYYLKYVIGEAVQMPDEAWRVLSRRWGLFFLAEAGFNEVLRYSLTWDMWVWFKTFGFIGLSMAFALANVPYMMKHMKDDQAAAGDGPQGSA
jgi:intracellular septation protein